MAENSAGRTIETEIAGKTLKPFAGAKKYSYSSKAAKNFGAGSSRQQAVDCFKSLGISAIIAESFGSIYERNAINNAMPILFSEDIISKINDGDEISIDFTTEQLIDKTQGETYKVKPFSKSQLEIYTRGGLL